MLETFNAVKKRKSFAPTGLVKKVEKCMVIVVLSFGYSSQCSSLVAHWLWVSENHGSNPHGGKKFPPSLLSCDLMIVVYIIINSSCLAFNILNNLKAGHKLTEQKNQPYLRKYLQFI